MPLFSRRKSGKQNSKAEKHAARKVPANPSQNLKEPVYFNGISTTPELPRKDYTNETILRCSNSTTKCVANFPRRSRLSKTLPEVLVDDSILPLLMEFLQKHKAQNVVNFWLAAETFRLSSRDRTLHRYKSRLKAKSVAQHPEQNMPCDIVNVLGDSEAVIGDHKIAIGDKFGDSAQLSDKDKNYLEDSNNSNLSLDSSQSSGKGRLEDSKLLHCYGKKSGCIPEADAVFANCTGESMSCQEDEGFGCITKNVIEMQKHASNGASYTSTFNKQCVVGVNAKVEGFSAHLLQNHGKKEHPQRSKSMMDDALSIYRHFISLDATQSVGVDEAIRRDVETAICGENGEIDPECFKLAQQVAFETLESRYFDDFVRSSYYQKHIMDILTSGKVFLADIMYNDNAVFYFMEFMEQEGKSYLLAFWFAVDSFRQELQSKLDRGEYNAEEALADAMILYEKYFSMQATHSLGVSDETRIRIENRICREEGPLPDCFEEPMENILTLLEEVYFPTFLQSSVYFKYLNELFSSVVDVDADQVSTCADDCSSTASGSDTSKLMESLASDVEVHEDPDEIWQRPNFGLSIGRVNEYGIYEPGIEPQPGKPKKSGASLSQKMKKFVSGDSYKVKEEMAWQVAKMVLEDVKRQQRKAPR